MPLKNTKVKKNIQKLGRLITWIARQSWFFALFLFLGFVVTGSIKNGNDLLEKMIICLVFWLFDFLFLKRMMTDFLRKVLDAYKKKSHQR